MGPKKKEKKEKKKKKHDPIPALYILIVGNKGVPQNEVLVNSMEPPLTWKASTETSEKSSLADWQQSTEGRQQQSVHEKLKQ